MPSNEGFLKEISEFCIKAVCTETDYELIIKTENNLTAVLTKLKEHGSDFVVQKSYRNRK